MANATKKEPKSGKKPSKSAMIRAYVKSHRKATPKHIAETLGVSESLVHNVRYNMKRGKKKGLRATAARADHTDHTPAEANPADICVSFVRAAGGFAAAKKMLMTAEAFAGLKIR